MRRRQHEQQPDKPDIPDGKSEKRARFWEWLGHTAAEGSNEAPNSSKRKQLAKGHTRWRHLPTEDSHFPIPEMRGKAQQEAHSEEADKKCMSELRSSLNATLPETGNNHDKTIGKTISRDEIQGLLPADSLQVPQLCWERVALVLLQVTLHQDLQPVRFQQLQEISADSARHDGGPVGPPCQQPAPGERGGHLQPGAQSASDGLRYTLKQGLGL